jgi:hypothetical protein
LDESELLGIVENEERAALGYHTGELASEREEALNYYLQKPFGNEVEGSSQVVDSSVRDTIEWMMPALLKIFSASGKAVEFEPTGLEDEEASKQATDACNYVFFKQNNGFLILYEWFKDALLEKNGVVKYWYEKTDTKKKETYYGLTEEQMGMLVKDENVEVLAHSSYPDEASIAEIMQQMQMLPPEQQAIAAQKLQTQPPMLHDVQIQISDTADKVKVCAIPPEEFLISTRHNSLSIQATPFCEHRVRKTISDLVEMGYSEKELEEIGSDDDFSELSPAYLARRVYEEERLANDDRKGPMREIWCRDGFIRVDYDGDGVAELRHFFIAGKKVLENEETDHINFAALSPIPMPHRFIGQSVAEGIMDIQLIKSTLWRQILNNLYLANNPRKAVLGTAGGMVYANLDDLLTSRVGGVVREYQPNAVRDLETPFTAAASFPMLEYLDQQRMNRSGVNQLSSGLDADAINKTARGAVLAQNQQAQKIELIARIFAETGVKDLFKGILYCLNKHSMKPMMMRLDNKFIPVDPRNWNTGWDMTVTVGLGTGDKDQQIMHLQLIGGMQEKLLLAGKGHMITDQNLYNIGKKIVENAGYKHAEEFITSPEGKQPPPPPPNPDMIKAQASMEETKLKLQADQQKSIGQASVEKLLKDIEVQGQITIARIQAETQMAIKQMELNAQSMLEDKKIRTEAEFEVFRANNEAAIKQAELDRQRESDIIKAQTSESASVRQAETSKETAKQKQLDSPRGSRGDDTKKTEVIVNGVVKALDDVQVTQKEMLDAVAKLKEEMGKPRKRFTKPIRDKEGNLVGAESVEQ